MEEELDAAVADKEEEVILSVETWQIKLYGHFGWDALSISGYKRRILDWDLLIDCWLWTVSKLYYLFSP
jgi:hypothetical protein